jgi:TRAP-type C4-dicarboxylate transport system permease small subunit
MKSLYTFEAFSHWLNHQIEMLLFILGITMAFVVALQVYFRYGLNQSLFWSEELARYLLVWLTFLGASVGYHRQVHPGIDIVYRALPALGKRIAAIVVHLICIVLFIVMILYGIQFAAFVRFQITPALNLPKWIVCSIVPISGAIMMFHATVFLMNEIRGKTSDR